MVLGARLKNTLHLVCYVGQEYKLVTTQLTKTVVLADVVSFCTRREVISQTPIVKAKRGPVPKGYREALNELERDGAIRIILRSEDFELAQFEILTPPPLDDFNGEEKEIIKETVHLVCQYTPEELSELTHNEAWELCEMGEEIPLGAYFPSKHVKATQERLDCLRNELTEAGYEFV